MAPEAQKLYKLHIYGNLDENVTITAF